MSRLFITSAVLVVTLVTGIALRFAGLLYGLPLDVAGDEFLHVATALAFMNDMSLVAWHSFSYAPTLIAVLLAPFYATFGLAGVVLGWFDGISSFKEFAILNSTWFLVGPRIISALAGAAFLGVLYLFTKRIMGTGAATIALMLATFDFWLVHESQLGHIWMPLTFLTLCSWYASLRIFQDGGRRWYVLGALSLVVGYWAGFIPALMLPWLALAHFMRSDHVKANLYLGAGIAISGLALVTFLNPYSFMRQFGGTVARGLLSVFGVDVFSSGLISETWRHASDGIVHPLENIVTMASVLFHANPLLVIVGVTGLIIFMYRKKLSYESLLLVGFPIAYLGVASLIWPNPDDRYILPLIAPLLIGAGYLFSEIYDHTRLRNRGIASGIVVMMFALTLLISVQVTAQYSKLFFVTDTRVAALDWIIGHIEDGALVATYGSHYFELPRNALVTQDLAETLPGELRTKDRYLLDRPATMYPSPSYYVLRDGEIDQLAAQGFSIPSFEYLVTTSFDPTTLQVPGLQYERIQRFTPRENGGAVINLLQDTDRWLLLHLLGLKNLGPYVEVYQRVK